MFALSRLLVVVVFFRLVMPVTLIGSAFVFDRFSASDYQTSLLALDQTGAALKALNTETAAVPKTKPHAPLAAPEEKKGLFSGAMDALNGAKDSVLAAKDKVTGALDASANAVQAKFENIRTLAESAAERMITLIVVFLMQTIVVPIILLFVLYRLLGGLVP